MKWYERPEFIILQQAWYQRLKEDGFEDAEEMIGHEMKLKLLAKSVHRNDLSELNRELKAAYFAMIHQSLFGAPFPDKIDRLILIRHAAGATNLAIAKELRQIGEPRCRNTVAFTIRKYLVAWGIRDFTEKQLNLKK